MSDETKKAEVMAMLIQVARTAHELAEDTEDDGRSLTVDEKNFRALEVALEALDELPEPAPNIFATGPAKAEAILFPAPVIRVCGVDCHQGDANCNGYCLGRAPRAKLFSEL